MPVGGNAKGSGGNVVELDGGGLAVTVTKWKVTENEATLLTLQGRTALDFYLTAPVTLTPIVFRLYKLIDGAEVFAGSVTFNGLSTVGSRSFPVLRARGMCNRWRITAQRLGPPFFGTTEFDAHAVAYGWEPVPDDLQPCDQGAALYSLRGINPLTLQWQDIGTAGGGMDGIYGFGTPGYGLTTRIRYITALNASGAPMWFSIFAMALPLGSPVPGGPVAGITEGPSESWRLAANETRKFDFREGNDKVWSFWDGWLAPAGQTHEVFVAWSSAGPPTWAALGGATPGLWVSGSYFFG